MDAERKSELCFVAESPQKETRGQISLRRNTAAVTGCYVAAALPPQSSLSLTPTIFNTLLCSGEYTLCMSTSCLTTGQFLQFITCLQGTSVWTGPMMQCKANVLESFWYVFFFLFVSKTKKYCSFKYCALHRIFCHKLVNIYIFFFNIQTYTFIYTGQ